MRQGFDKETILLLMDAWRPSTKKVYSAYIRKWMVFCVERNIYVVQPTLPQACRFLRVLASSGVGYGALNTARCALSTILPSFDGRSFGTHPYVCWIVKGGYERNPPKPRYTQFWDVSKVFKILKDWGPSSGLTLKRLSWKLTMLLLLVSSQRGQTIKNLSTEGMVVEEHKIVFKMSCLLKHNRLGDRLTCIEFKDFSECKRLCVVRCVKEYLKRTAEFRKTKQLLLSFVRPFGPISRDTLARWTLKVMSLAGVDTNKYGGHSTRGASTSAAKRLGIPINIILKHASWRSVQSFANHYDKELEPEVGQVGRELIRAALR